METWQDTEHTSEPKTIYDHYWRWLGLIFLICLLGIIISVRVPLWLAPPHAHDTPLLYVPILFAWLILLIVLSLAHRIKTTVWNKLGFALVAVVEVLAFLTVVVFWGMALFDCSPATITDGTAHYTCTVTITGLVPATDSGNVSVDIWQFQGLPNFPIVSLIDTRSQ